MDNQNHKDKMLFNQKHQHFVELQNQCPLCGSQLAIRVQIEVGSYLLTEEAKCEECDVFTRVKSHRLH